MSVTVSFADPLSPSKLEDIRALIESIPPKSPLDHWRVHIKAGDEGSILEVSGPQHHHRSYRIYGDASCDPVYLAALVRTEINAFPSAPPDDVVLALATLARIGVPYDDANIFSGRVSVIGEDFPVKMLAELYRNEQLAERFNPAR